MKVKEFLSQYRFDELIPHIIAHDSNAADQIAHYREAFDIIMHTEPKHNDEVLRVEYDREFDYEIPYITACHCDDDAWAWHLGKELSVEQGIAGPRAAAAIMWEMTYRGFSPEVIASEFERIMARMESLNYDNQYEEKMDYLTHQLNENYEPKRYRRKWSGCKWVSVDIEALHDEKRLKYYSERKAHRNRPKRMRDSRQERRIEQLKHLSRIETIIKRIRERVPEIPNGELEWLRRSDYIETGRYDSRAYDLSRRMEYLWESLTVYDKIEPLPDSKTVILVRTSPEHPLTDAERTTLDRIAALYSDPSQVTLYVGTDPSLGTEADLYIVRTQKR